MGQYIPDITERFPEGFGGVDMTPSFFGQPVDYSRAYGYEPSDEEFLEEESVYEDKPEPSRFEVGQTYTRHSIFGAGVTHYTVSKFNKKRDMVFLTETWQDLDGEGTRKGEWHKLEVLADGSERCLEWESEKYGQFWIYAV